MSRRAAGNAAATCLAAASLAAGAAAATVVGGGTYRGHLTGKESQITISFRVSTDRHQVQAVHLGSLPIYCAGKGPPAAKIVFAPAQISVTGTFTASGKDAIAVGPLKGTAVARLTVTGTFAGDRREHGTVSVVFAGTATRCNGRSPYSTSA